MATPIVVDNNDANNTTLVFGDPVEPDVSPGNWFLSPGKQKTKTGSVDGSECLIVSRYVKDLRRYMLSPTMRGKRIPVVQLGAPTLLWICRWRSIRFNARPTVPSSVPVVADWTLLHEQLSPVSIITGSNGTTPIYRMTGTYIYSHGNPNEQLYKDVRFPLAAWLQNDFDRDIPDQNIERGLLDGSKGQQFPSAP